MQEQTIRTDVNDEHIQTCTTKLHVLEQQRTDLLQALLELCDDYEKGLKKPKLYHQFKMYNDPNLNPALYRSK